MKVLNRDVSRYLRRWREIHHYLLYLVRCIVLFRKPFRVFWSYLTLSSPVGRRVTLRNGLVIHLSDHPHDVVTVFVVFVRREYGTVRPETTVVDIGANIGVFTLYAAYQGARRVIALEPNAECFHVLQRNIRDNGLERAVVPHRAAVIGVAGGPVPFPISASMYHAIGDADGTADYDMVDTTDLRSILAEVGNVDLLKMDCEGSEYDILLDTSPDVLQRLRQVRFEYHRGRLGEIESVFDKNGYSRERLVENSPKSGILWYVNDRGIMGK